MDWLSLQVKIVRYMANQKKIYRFYLLVICIGIISGILGIFFDIGQIGSFIALLCVIVAVGFWIFYATERK